MKRHIFSLFISLMFSITATAYDFEAKSLLGDTFYFNITSTKEAEVNTCEVTYFDEEINGNNIVYNKNNKHYNGYKLIPSRINYQGITYVVLGIGAHAFQDTNITYISPGSDGSISYIGCEAFKNCSLLTKFEQSCTRLKISDGAFENCKSLESFWILSSSKPYETIKISSHVFHGCSGLKDILVIDAKPENFEIANEAFDMYNERINCTLIVSPGNKEHFEKVEPWCYFSEILEEDIEAPTSIETIKASTRPTSCRNAFGLNGNSVDPLFYKGIYIINGKKIIRK